MAVKMLRKPSETPNITNIDDIIGMRYAYGNQNGYVKGKGTELSYEINGLNFTINSGRLVIQGVEIDIDANGITLEIENVSNLRYFIVYAKVDLGLNNVEIVATHNSLGYPVLPTSQDLTQYTNGIAYLELYRFTTTGASISNVIKVVNFIEYYKDKIDKVINGDIQVKKATNAIEAEKIKETIIYEDDTGIKTGDSCRLFSDEFKIGYKYRFYSDAKVAEVCVKSKNISIIWGTTISLSNGNIENGVQLLCSNLSYNNTFLWHERCCLLLLQVGAPIIVNEYDVYIKKIVRLEKI